MDNLPAPHIPHDQVVRLPDGRYIYADQALTPYQPQATGPQVIHQHIHQAPPDRTLQRIALGAGAGGGAIVTGVYFGPVLIAAMASMAISLAVVAVVIVALVWGAKTVVLPLVSPDRKDSSKNRRV